MALHLPAGKGIAIITGTGKRVATAFDGYMHGAPYLHIQYTLPTVTPTPTYTPTNTPAPTQTLIPTITLTPTRTPTPTATVPSSFSGATFVYDGDGKRVKSIFNGTTTTYFVGAHYEVTGSTVTKYYYAGAQRIAMRAGGAVNYLLGDHLGSTSLTTSATGTVLSELRYKAWGEVRYASGTTPTKYTYTAQYSYASDFGLLFYNARWVDPSLGRFAQADAAVPGGVQGYDRYAYSNNNPIRYIDPSGHMPIDDGCPDCKWPNHNKYTETAQKSGDKSGGYMATYTIAAIGVQNPRLTRWYLPKGLGGYFPYMHLGIAKVSDKEMDTPYGESIWDSEVHTSDHFRGYGLGMKGQDQTDPEVAVKAMTTRIEIVTNACDDKCTSTDIFLIAALAQNGPDFKLDNLDDLMHAETYKPRPQDATHSLNWELFLNNASKKEFYQDKLIGPFAANVLYLQGQDWDVPDDIDWQYVYNLYTLP